MVRALVVFARGRSVVTSTRGSTTAQRTPARASSSAAASPPGPPPAISTGWARGISVLGMGGGPGAQQERRGSRPDVRDGARRAGRGGTVGDAAAEQQRRAGVRRARVGDREAGRGGVGGEGGEVGRPVPVDDGVHALTGERGQGGQVPAGRLAPPRAPARPPQLPGVRGEPGQAPVDVVERCGERGLAAEPVVQRGDREPGRGQLGERGPRPAREHRPHRGPAPDPPAAAVQEHHERNRGGGVGPDEVEQQRPEAGHDGVLRGAPGQQAVTAERGQQRRGRGGRRRVSR